MPVRQRLVAGPAITGTVQRQRALIDNRAVAGRRPRLDLPGYGLAGVKSEGIKIEDANMRLVAPVTAPSQTGPSNTYIYPSVDAAGTLYIAFASFSHPAKTSTATLYVSHSSDDGQTFAPFVPAATVGVLPATSLPNTTFRDGIRSGWPCPHR